MFQIIREKTLGKSFAVTTAMTFLFQIAYPTFSYGLTSGPSQPEVESFSSINTSDMVDLFSGDFSYNIPLMNVPGPNGGYPINLGYNAGIGVEQEASWVGLGWNINPGVVNREVKSLPDDFNGDLIEKKHYQKDNITVGFTIPTKTLTTEIFGLDIQKILPSTTNTNNILFKYNNYNGLDISFNTPLSSVSTESLLQFGGDKGVFSPITAPGGFLEMTETYTEATVVYGLRKGYASAVENILNKLNFMKLYRSANKDDQLNLTASQRSYRNFNLSNNLLTDALSVSDKRGVGLPRISTPYNNTSFEFKANLGGTLFGATLDGDLEGLFIRNKIADNVRHFRGFGYLYSENYDRQEDAGSSEEKLMDFEVSNEFSPTSRTKTLGIPIFNKDIFFVKAEGIGGVVSLKRGDVGILKNPKTKNSDVKVGLGADLSFGPPGEFKAGVNPSLNTIDSYSGPWQDGKDRINSIFSFKTNKGVDYDIDPDQVPYYETAYLGAKGELVPNNWNSKMVDVEQPLRFRLGKSLQGFSIKTSPHARNLLISPSNTNYNGRNTRTNRATRVQSYEFLTVQDLIDIDASYNGGNPEYTKPSYAKNHHIGQISTTTPEGLTYVFGLPAYSNTKEEHYFSVGYGYQSVDTLHHMSKIITYNPKAMSKDNDHGQERQYTKTVTPAYAHSFLLTEIRSADYIDADGNNIISDDDLGGYVKFNYDKAHSAFKWRVPLGLNKANFLPGKLSDSEDDKASVTYGEKEIYYLEEIETKTHIAVFSTLDRDDGLGVSDVNGSINTGTKLKRLHKIDLYEKADYKTNQSSATPIKTVHFEYDYSLAKGVPNNTQSTTDTTGGKLTLKKVYFTYGGYETKSALNPYEFDYHEDITAENPNYRNNYDDSDRWGNYQRDNKKSSFPFISNRENPYVNPLSDYNNDEAIDIQDELDRNNAAGVWSLKEIHIPSGGTIKIDYEQDDYAYVQNKRAMQMCRIIGEDPSGPGNGEQGLGADDKIFFKLNEPISNSAQLDRYFTGIKGKNTYFKAWVQLKNFSRNKDRFSGTPMRLEGKACDYVSGYAKIKEWGFNLASKDPDTQKYSTAWLKLEPVQTNSTSIGKLNPIRVAALQYIAYNRSDLSPSSPIDISDFASINPLKGIGKITSMIVQGKKNLENPILKGWINGYAKKLNMGDNTTTPSKPSYIRLNVPNYIKYGGGHRVKQITVADNWSSMTNSNEKDYDYGQTFDYTLEDGEKSSGVALYEPSVGGEENPFRQPVFGGTDRYLFNDPSKMAEEPMGEEYFPSAQVGYSRVVVKSLQRKDKHNLDISTATSGYSVNEFYTAKDYPVITKRTSIEKVNAGTGGLNDFIKFIGGANFYQPGYSQGYYIETNNMHGKQKSVATYPFLAEPNEANSTSLSRFIYKTKGGYSEGKVNKLSSKADILLNDGEIKENMNIGKETEFFVYMNENSMKSFSPSLLSNLSQMGLLIFIPFAIIKLDSQTKLERTIVTNKVVHKSGILEKVITTQEGSAITTENLLFDSETGSPLLTSITTDYHNANTPELNKIYNYQYPGHWTYESMGGAYQNIGAIITPTNYKDIIYPGDVLLGTDDELYWIEEVDDPAMAGEQPLIKDKSNTNISTINSALDGSKIIRSGRRNQQSIVTGSITSIYDPLDPSNMKYPLFDSWNNSSIPDNPTNASINEAQNCIDGTYSGVNVSEVQKNGLPAIEFKTNGTCFSYVVFPNPSINDLHAYSLQRQGNTAIATNGSKKYLCQIIDKDNCHSACLDGILNATSVTFSDSLGYEESTLPSGISASVMNANKYRYGKKGVWKQEHQLVYQEDRKQKKGTGSDKFKTKSQIDGTYKSFVPYNWQASVANNDIWTRANTVTKYDAYGNELENENALNIYASALYGYQNTLTTAVINNAKYTEVAFDAYEDYGASPSSPYNHGNFNFTGSGVLIDGSEAHTGSSSLKVPSSNATCTFDLSSGEDNEKYILNFWVKGDISSSTIPATVTVGATTYNAEILAKVDDWYNAEVVFDKATASTVSISLASSTNRYFDDIRLQPFNSVLKTYVYHPLNFRLLAELDENNFATFYNYDEEGKLIQIKKETSRGIQTLQNNRTVLQSSLNP